METNVQYTVIGAFVISLIACIILSVIWLTSGLSTKKVITYRIYMSESVSGLNQNSSVEYNGVAVGSVTSIKLNRRNPQLVELLLNIDENTPITKGTRATLKVKGLTGVAVIALKDNGTDPEPLVKENGQHYPIIPTIPSFYQRLDTILDHLANSMQSLLDKDNLAAFKKILANFAVVSTTFSDNHKQIADFIQNTSKASKEFPALMQSGQQAIHLLNAETLPTVGQITTNINEFSQEIKQNPAVLIRGKAETTLLGPGE